MTDASAALAAATAGRTWTCPFCPLACDHLGAAAVVGTQTLRLIGGECPRASAALATFPAHPAPASPSVDGIACDLDTAVAAAARLLEASSQPLFGGLGTDVAGARALYPLACATGAIVDVAGPALIAGLRALQDRGQYTTTFAEVRTRADVVVFVGGLPTDVAPLIAERCGLFDPQVPQRRVVLLGFGDGDERHLEDAAARAGAASWADAAADASGAAAAVRPEVESIALEHDLFDSVALLAALVAGRTLPAAPAPLRALAARLGAARYAVFVGAPARLPAEAALLIEAVHQVVAALNKTTRAAALWVGGGNGAATVNQVLTWLSGLPLRSRAGPRGLEHEPALFDGARLIAEGGADALLWVASFDATSMPLPCALPRVVLGHPALAAALAPPPAQPTPPAVFIPVATPGIGSDGHLFRTDGTVLMPLHAVYRDALPTVAEVAGRIGTALRRSREAAPEPTPEAASR